MKKKIIIIILLILLVIVAICGFIFFYENIGKIKCIAYTINQKYKEKDDKIEEIKEDKIDKTTSLYGLTKIYQNTSFDIGFKKN